MKSLKKWWLAAIGIIGFPLIAWAVYSYTGVAVNVLAMVTPAAVYTNAVVYTLVDQANVIASLTANNIVDFGTLTSTGALTVSGGGATVSGASTISTTTFNGGVTLWSITSTQELLLTPSATGQMVFCSNCANTSQAKPAVCVSTGNTAPGQFVIVGSATVTACQ